MASLLFPVNSSQIPAAELTYTIQSAISSVLFLVNLFYVKFAYLTVFDFQLFCDLSPDLNCQCLENRDNPWLYFLYPNKFNKQIMTY